MPPYDFYNPPWRNAGLFGSSFADEVDAWRQRFQQPSSIFERPTLPSYVEPEEIKPVYQPPNPHQLAARLWDDPSGTGPGGDQEPSEGIGFDEQGNPVAAPDLGKVALDVLSNPLSLVSPTLSTINAFSKNENLPFQIGIPLQERFQTKPEILSMGLLDDEHGLIGRESPLTGFSADDVGGLGPGIGDAPGVAGPDTADAPPGAAIGDPDMGDEDSSPSGGSDGPDGGSDPGSDGGGGGSASGDDANAYHHGGYVADGKKGTFRDNVKASLQEGEYVMPRYAVDYFGIDALDAMRHEANPHSEFRMSSGERKGLFEKAARMRAQQGTAPSPHSVEPGYEKYARENDVTVPQFNGLFDRGAKKRKGMMS